MSRPFIVKILVGGSLVITVIMLHLSNLQMPENFKWNSNPVQANENVAVEAEFRPVLNNFTTATSNLSSETQLPVTFASIKASVLTNQFNRTYIHLDSAEPGIDNSRIFFQETSGRTFLTFRESCAVESAARENPSRSVQMILFNESIDVSHASFKLLGEYSNVDIFGIHPDAYYANTSLEEWYTEGRWRTGSWPVIHLADYSRILSLWKAGGIYMDTDFVILKELKDLHNFSCYESTSTTSNGVLGLSHGHPMINYMIDNLIREYQPNTWTGNGPERLYRALKYYCKESQIIKMTREKCQGFHLMKPVNFYPVFYKAWMDLFTDVKTNDLSRFNESYTLHAWNKLSAKEPIHVGSRQIYALAAAKHCPLTFAAAATEFR